VSIAVNACIDYNAVLETFAMPTLTIRDLDESLKRSLRLRAASRNRSMEEEARQILRAALQHEPPQGLDLAARIRARVAVFGGVDLPIAPREPVRPPPTFDDQTPTAKRPRAASRSPRPAATPRAKRKA
jgi:antitoxin FitA